MLLFMKRKNYLLWFIGLYLGSLLAFGVLMGILKLVLLAIS